MDYRRKYVINALCIIFCIVHIIEAQYKPNIIVIMGDDVGWFNLEGIKEQLQKTLQNQSGPGL